jgi:hypothetical protein
MAEDHLILEPRAPKPGCLAVVAPVSRIPFLESLEQKVEARRYIVRAVVSDQVPLVGRLDELMASRPVGLVQLQTNPMTAYVHHGGRNAVFFDLHGNADGWLSHIDTEVECDLPRRALEPARTQLNSLLDTVVGSFWMPLVITRLELYLKGDQQVLLRQLVLPFTQGVRYGLLGGWGSFPPFDPYESLLREALSSSSPFYRFLCAYRLYEGMNALRRTLRELATKVGSSVKLPSDPKLDLEMLGAMGFRKEFLQGIQTVGDFHAKLTETRNRVAHFLLRGDEFVVNTSNGFYYDTYSMGATALLHYAHEALVDLRRHYESHLSSKLRVGEVLPLVEQRDMFVIRLDPSREDPGAV